MNKSLTLLPLFLLVLSCFFTPSVNAQGVVVTIIQRYLALYASWNTPDAPVGSVLTSSVNIDGNPVPTCQSIVLNKCNIDNLSVGTHTVTVFTTDNSSRWSGSGDGIVLPELVPYLSVLCYSDLLSFNFSSTGSQGPYFYTFTINDTQPYSAQSPGIYNYSGLPSNTLYHVIFAVTDNFGIVKQIEGNYVTMPPRPSGAFNASATPKTPNSVLVKWNESKNGVIGDNSYTVVLEGSSSYHYPSQCQRIRATSCLIDNLVSNTTYVYLIVTYNANYTAVPSTLSMFTTLPSPITNTTTCLNNCSNHGVCSFGSCVCDLGWNGYLCDINSQQNTTTNINNNATVDVNANGTYSFRFMVGDLVEKDIDGLEVKRVNLSSLNWSLSSFNQTFVTNPTTLTQFVMNQTTFISNHTYMDSINITFIQIDYVNGSNGNSSQQSSDIYPLQFLGETINLKVGSFKYSLSIKRWHFDNFINTLDLVSNIILPSLNGGCESPTFQAFENGDIQTSIVIDDNGNQVYARLINKGLIDSFILFLKHQIVALDKTDSDNNEIFQITTSLPNFNNLATIDPDFSLLVTRNNGDIQCNEEKDDKWKAITIGVVVGVVGAAILTMGVYLIVKNRRKIKLAQYKMREVMNKE